MGIAMFGYLELRWKLWKLARTWDVIESAQEERHKEAKARHASSDELSVIESEEAGEYFEYQNAVYKAHTRYLTSKAYRLIVAIPTSSDEGMWEEDHGDGRRYLTEKGIGALRAAIRAEQKARVEMFLMWMPGVVGILGALIGLASVLVGRK
jgi:hypothetical protein